MVNYRNILVIQTAFIGDAILASSLLEKLHAYFPEAKISILVRKGNEGIYKNHPFLQEILVWNKKENKLKNLFKLWIQIRKNKYDCVIDCHRYASSGFLTAFSGARHSAGYKQTPFAYMFNTAVRHVIGDGRHEVERYNQLIEDFTDKKIFKPKLYPSQGDFKKAEHLSAGKYVCMTPASVWFTKQLPFEKWVELCNKANSDTKIYLLGGAEDKRLCERIREASSNKNIQVLAGELSLLQSCALMKNAQMNYVNDSAPMHLASSVNAPVTVFYCSTIPELGFGPLSNDSTILQVKDLKCRPCGIHGYKECPLGHFQCGKNISLDI